MTTIPLRTKITQLLGTESFAVRRAGQVSDERIESADMYLNIQKNTNAVYARDGGAKFDGIELLDITATSGSAVISSASRPFVAADVGKTFALFSSILAATSTIHKVGTILSVSSGNATMSVNATSNIAGTGILRLATDDTAALQACVDTPNPDDNTTSGTWTYKKKGVVILPAGMSAVTQGVVMRTGVSITGQGKWASTILWHSTTNMATTEPYYAALLGVNANGSTRIYKYIYFTDFGVDMRAATVGTYSYHSKCSEIVQIHYGGVIRCAGYGSPGTSFGWDYVCAGLFTENHIFNPGRLWVTGGGGGSAFDFQSQANLDPNLIDTSLEAVIMSRNIIVNPKVSGIRNSDNQTNPAAPVNSRTLICNNIIVTLLTQGKGIEDQDHTGAIIIGNILVAKNDQKSEGNLGAGGNGAGQETWAGILIDGGQYGICAHNTVVGGWYDGIKMIRHNKGSGTIQPDEYVIDGNTVKGSVRHGIRVEANATFTLKNVSITNNKVSLCGEAGIALTYITGGAAGTINFLDLSNNKIHDNGRTTATDAQKSGIYINTVVTKMKMVGNYIWDSGTAKQKYGMTIDTVAVTGALVANNDMASNVTQAINLINGGTLAGEVYNNPGYNLGAIAVTPGASPYTYTAGATPEVLYIRGGTVSDVSKNSVTLAVATGLQVNLRPNEQVVITYSSVPTIVADRK